MSITPPDNFVNPKPKSTIDLLRESRDQVAKELDAQQKKTDELKKELSRLDKAIKQWEPKE